MTFDNSYILVTVGNSTITADRAVTMTAAKVSALPLYAGGFDRRILGGELTVTAEGRYITAEQSAAMKTLFASFEGAVIPSVTVGGVTYTNMYAEKATLTETDGDPLGKFLLVLKKL